MIHYQAGFTSQLLLGMRGSVLPYALRFAIPAAILAIIMKTVHLSMDKKMAFMNEVAPTPYTSFTGVLAVLIVFRNGQAYERYYHGGALLQQMVGSWFNAASCIMAFTRVSKKSPEEVCRFQHAMCRLFSLMSALALLELEEDDTDDVDADEGEGSDESEHLARESASMRKASEVESCMEALKVIDSDALEQDIFPLLSRADLKVEMVYYMIQVCMVKAIDTGMVGVPAPVASNFFAAMNAGLVSLEDAKKLSFLPFPFPYAQTSMWLLMAHFIATPYMVATFTHNPVHAGVCAFLLTLVLWTLTKTSMELENPFGRDDNDIDLKMFQEKNNSRLKMLLRSTSMREINVKDGISEEELKEGAQGIVVCLSGCLDKQKIEAHMCRQPTKYVSVGKKRLVRSDSLGALQRVSSHSGLQAFLHEGTDSTVMAKHSSPTQASKADRSSGSWARHGGVTAAGPLAEQLMSNCDSGKSISGSGQTKQRKGGASDGGRPTSSAEEGGQRASFAAGFPDEENQTSAPSASGRSLGAQGRGGGKLTAMLSGLRHPGRYAPLHAGQK